ncbi:MAG TPA: HAMP domain-containing protein, partial [Nitrolancea sp.]|nr:HAMP domain-containing protein [Nitrolancea sp.]
MHVRFSNRLLLGFIAVVTAIFLLLGVVILSASDQQIIVALVVAGIAVLIAGIVFTRLATRPLEDIVAMTRRVSHGDLSARAEEEPRSEFGDVALAFNEMADELEATFSAIELERKRLDSVVEHLADGIIIVDGEGRVAMMNLAAESLLGIKRVSSIGRSYAEVLRDYELAAVVLEGQSIPQVDAAPTATIIEMGLPRRWIQAFSYSIPSGEPQLTLVVLRDITELR